MPLTKPSGASPNLEKAMQALAMVRSFRELSHDVQMEIARVAVPRHFQADQFIYLEGEPSEALYILSSGWVKSIHLSPDGREQAIMFLQAGEIFGDIAVFLGAPYPATVVALEPVDVWSIRRVDVLDLLSRHHDLALAVIRRLSERILHFVNLVDDLTLRNVEARLARTLLQHTETVDGRMIVPRRQWTTFDEMAVRLGTVRDVLGRILRGLENDGLLRVERNAIVILDPKGLAQRGEN